jgi:hypothetical protein
MLRYLMQLSDRGSVVSSKVVIDMFVFYAVHSFVTALYQSPNIPNLVRFEVFTAVTMKNGVFWDVTPCGSCKNRRFGGT